MANIQLTLFNANNKTDSKIAISKYENEQFIFINKEVQTLTEAYLIMSQEWVLSQPLKLIPNKPITLNRRIVDLTPHKYYTLKNIVLDLDNITTSQDYLDTIQYFKDKNFSCVLGKSRSWDGVNSFNMKGILRVSFKNDPEVIQTALTQLQVELGSKCKIDLSVSTIQSYQAPSRSKFIIHSNEDGHKYTDKDVHIADIKEVMGGEYKINLTYNNEIVDKCIEIFSSLGYIPIRNGETNGNGSVNFYHPSESKSKGGFFWYSTQPLVMHHNNKDRSISIFNLLKDTTVGKKWLKDKTKEEQKHQLLREDNSRFYKKDHTVNERYLDFGTEEKHKILDDFLDSEKDVLKIKSAMGTAKSNGIQSCISKAHRLGKNVIIISNRVSVALDFAEKYNIKWYQDEDIENHDGSLVVQFDSLHRFNVKDYDIVILDEFISLMFHHINNLSNNNINIIKFKILMETKKVLIADAFLTGFEDVFFKNRNISRINNNYRDSIDLYEYQDKNHFIETLLETAKSHKLSASFTSNRVMKVVHYELVKQGIKSIILNADTPKYTRDLIYKRFKEETHNSYDVILYSPTLTVGVSNLNNIEHHFHYDSGMSIDVISSLQMIKRTRKVKYIHCFLEERQFYYDTDVKSINKIAEKNINTFYHNKDSTLLIDVNYETGDLKLTKLSKYINQIEALHNITKNNHSNAFKTLIGQQFDSKFELKNPDYISTFDLKSSVKNIKLKEKEYRDNILQEWGDTSSLYLSEEIEDIKNKNISLTESEQVEIIISEIQNKFTLKVPHIDLIMLAKDNNKLMSKINKFNMASKSLNNEEYSKYLLAQTVSESIGNNKNLNLFNFLKYVVLISNYIPTFKDRYSKNEIKDIDNKLGSKQFEKFLKKIGYEWGEAKLIINPDIKRLSKFK